MRKPRPPHQARRVHGPRAALAGYKNLASSISCSSSPSSFFHNPEFSTSAMLGARASNPTSSNQAPPDRPRRSCEDHASEVRAVFNKHPRSAPTTSMLLSSCDADPLSGLLAWVELRAQQRPGLLAICLAVAPSPSPPSSAFRRLRCHGLGLHTWIQQPVAEMPHDDAARLLPSCALYAAGG